MRYKNGGTLHKLIGHLGGPYKVAMSVTVEKRQYHGDHSYRAAEVSKDAHRSTTPMLANKEISRYMALPQHKKLPQPAEGTTFG